MNHTSAKAQRPRKLVRSLVLVVAPDRAQAVAAATEPPLSVTKRGALLFARKSR